MKRWGPYLALIGAIVTLDQISKALVVRSVGFYDTIPVIPGFFNLTHIHNKGAIFGIFSNAASPLVSIGLVVLALAALVMIALFFRGTTDGEKGPRLALALILGGALGNQVDRIFRGHVVDFLDFYVKRLHWPTFNLADACISTGAVVLLLTILFRRPHASDPV